MLVSCYEPKDAAVCDEYGIRRGREVLGSSACSVLLLLLLLLLREKGERREREWL